MTQQNVATATSGNSQIQLKEQNILLGFTTSKDEYDLAVCLNSPQIKDSKTGKEDLVDVVVLWRMLIGIPKTDIAEELVLMAGFISSNYGFLTIDEIKLAINLSIRRKLKDTDFNGYFSPMYAAKVLDSYIHYRKITLADAIRRRNKAISEDLEKKNKPTPEMQAKDFRELATHFYEQWQQKGEINDVFSLMYNFLRRTKMLEVPKSMIDEAQKYAKAKIQEIKNKNVGGKISFDLNIDEMRWARNYCVQKYFETVDINVLRNNIKAEHFQ